MSAADQMFMAKAARGGMEEVAMGKLAASHAKSPKIRAFGERMVSDHSAANQELTALAARKRVTLPTGMSKEGHAMYAHLKTLRGHEFDVAYQNAMLEDHRKDVAEFQRQSKTATDPDLRAWVIKTLPTLKEHLRMIERISLR